MNNSNNHDTINLEIDELTPCLEEASSGQILKTTYSIAEEYELKNLKDWKFDWLSSNLNNAEIYTN